MKIKTEIILRVIFDLLLLIVAAFMPWWFTFLIATISTLAFKNFWEILFVGIWIDSVGFEGIFYSIPFMFSITAALIYIAAETVKRVTRVSN